MFCAFVIFVTIHLNYVHSNIYLHIYNVFFFYKICLNYNNKKRNHVVLVKNKLNIASNRIKSMLHDKCIALSGTGSIIVAVVKNDRGSSVSNVGLCWWIKAFSFSASRIQASTCSFVGLSVIAMTRTMMSDPKLRYANTSHSVTFTCSRNFSAMVCITTGWTSLIASTDQSDSFWLYNRRSAAPEKWKGN